MVKTFFLLLFLFSFILHAEDVYEENDLLSKKIESFLGEEVYTQKLNFINVIFEVKSNSQYWADEN